jgi:hypothetical protein
MKSLTCAAMQFIAARPGKLRNVADDALSPIHLRVAENAAETG